MQRKSKTELSRRILVFGSIATIALIVVFGVTAITGAGSEVTAQQDVMRLDNRITQLEQRLFSIENNLRNLEQQVRLSSVPARGANQDELGRLRSDLELLQRRVTDHDCGLAKLDERTLTPQRRVERRRLGSGDTDACRLNFETPLRVP